MDKGFLNDLDARTKIIGTLLIVLSMVVARSWLGYAVTVLVVAFAVAGGGVPWGRLVRAVVAIRWLLFFTLVLHILLTPGDTLIQFGPVSLSTAGLYRAFHLGARLTLLVILTTVLTVTTEPFALAEGVQFLLSPLRWLRVPVPEMALVTSISLRFVPIILEEAGQISRAQRARGIDSRTISPVERVMSIGAILVPLFMGALRRADELGDAMEARGFVPGAIRGRFRERRLGRKDGVVLTLCALCLVSALFF